MEFRFVRPEEMAAYNTTLGIVFGHDPYEGDQERFEELFELDRLIGAFEDGELVGTAGAFTFDLTVPGGIVPMGATTVITVRPSHRRKGALNGMMRVHLDEIRSKGEPVAGLWASESSIYERYGYGLAAYRGELTIDRRHAALIDAHDVPGKVRMLEAAQAAAAFPAVYDRVRSTRPGMLSRPPVWWKLHRLFDPSQHRQGATAYRFALYEDEAGAPAGYALYRQRSAWDGGFPSGTLMVTEVMAETSAAHEAIWRYLLGVDLVTTITAWNQPVDEALPWRMTDPRRGLPKIQDTLWIRLVDLPAALAGRRYRVPGAVVLGVTDPFCPWNEGTWRLEGGPDGATCEATTDAPEVVLTAADLGALYLGGNRLSALAWGGRASGDPAAIALADLMFSWDRAPWCPETF